MENVVESIEEKVAAIIKRLERDLGDPIVYVKDREKFLEILSEYKVVVANFSAPWCNPCKAYLPVFRRIARGYLKKYGNESIVFIYADTDAMPDIADKYKVDNIPTTIVFIHGHVADVIVGVTTESRLQEKLDSIIKEVFRS
ncbi:MAG: thioredoxin family protein [Pyrodictiaceae archaeon]